MTRLLPAGAVQGAKYNIGGQDYTCDDLENGVLRCNRPAASSIGMLLGLPSLSKGPFGPQDPRRQHVSAAQGGCCCCVAHAFTWRSA